LLLHRFCFYLFYFKKKSPTYLEVDDSNSFYFLTKMPNQS
jgi:hypothetical protein